jgi:hypothetical protein
MLETKLLYWLQIVSSWYILVPLALSIFRWKTHDVVRRRVAWFAVFNVCFTGITLLFEKLKINNLFMFYLASPLFLWVVYRIFEPLIGTYKIWQWIKYLVIGFAIFVVIDMFWIEDFRTKFPDNIYPAQEIIILLMVYYFLYIFSKEARQDFSSLWISIGIGISALLILISLIYNPYLGFKPNTFGYFVWVGLGSISDILSYSFITYGLYIARPKLER